MSITTAKTEAYELKHQYYALVLTYQPITVDWSGTQNQNMSSLRNTHCTTNFLKAVWQLRLHIVSVVHYRDPMAEPLDAPTLCSSVALTMK
jgi:hypothetical protein